MAKQKKVEFEADGAKRTCPFVVRALCIKKFWFLRLEGLNCETVMAGEPFESPQSKKIAVEMGNKIADAMGTYLVIGKAKRDK